MIWKTYLQLFYRNAATGASDDYAAGVAEIPLVYTIELPGPGPGLSGFDLPVSQIQPVVTEMFRGFRAYAQHVIEISKK